MNFVDWSETHAALWRARRQTLKPVAEADLDIPPLDRLLGIERQKAALLDNLRRFTHGQPANHALLWGARGCGKSSLVKAVFGVLRHEGHDDSSGAHPGSPSGGPGIAGLRLVQIDKEDLLDLPDLVDELRHAPYRFLIFCDDLSFQPGEPAFRALKTVLDGSIERPADNLLLVATSNRRHLIPERMADNLAASHSEGELHLGDAIEEQLALADRFGLWLSFYPPDQDTFLAMVAAHGVALDEAARLEAIRFATTRGGRSGRAARQFGQSRPSWP